MTDLDDYQNDLGNANLAANPDGDIIIETGEGGKEIEEPAGLKEGNSKNYLDRAFNFSILDKTEEIELARRWQRSSDQKAAHKLVEHHLQLVIKIAQSYKNYGIAMSDLIAEGNIGLMRSLKNFDPSQGWRFATYASFWIKAAINSSIMNSWSLVKMCTTQAQRKLFFRLRSSYKDKIAEGKDQDTAQKELAEELGVDIKDIQHMQQRFSQKDLSLNQEKFENGASWQESIVDQRKSQEQQIIEKDLLTKGRNILQKAMEVLNPRQQEIFRSRRLSDPPVKLHILAEKFQLSSERVRQIENSVMKKIQKYIKNNHEK